MLNKQRLVSALTLIIIGVAYFLGGDGLSGLISPQTQATVSENSLIIENVTVYDLDGSVAYRGNVDLAPELARIERGERDPHDNDGGVFGNREGLLPQQARGYYREYVVRTPGIRHAGPQRLVIGEGGEAYYTHDHYASFVRIR